MKTPVRIAAAAALLAAVLSAHEGHRGIEAKGVKVEGGRLALDPRTERAIGLATAPARRARVEESLTLNATVALVPGARSFASSRISGTIASVRTAVGARVRAGDVLATVESLPLEALVLQWKQGEEDLRLARADLERASAVAPAVLPEQELEALRAAVEDRALAAASAAWKLRVAGLAEADIAAMSAGGPVRRILAITSPADGVVSHVDVAVGEPVAPDRHLIEIDDDRAVRIEADVPEAFAADAVPGRATRTAFEAIPGAVFEAPVSFVSPRADDGQRTIRIAVSLPRERAVLPGTPGRLDLIRRSGEGLLVPRAALGRAGLDRFVLVELGDGRYRRQEVVPGILAGDDVEILSGLVENDRVVTAGAAQLASLFAAGTLDVHPEARRAWDIRLAEVDLRVVDEVVRIPAVLRVPPGAAGFAAPLTGGKIRRILAFPGDAVAAGAPLAEIESSEVQDAEVDLVRSVRRLALLDGRAEALRGLEKKGIPARKELLRVEAEQRAERLVEHAVRARLAAWGVAAADIEAVLRTGAPADALVLRSPVAGTVVAADLAVGQVVDADERLFEVADVTRLRAEGALSGGDLPRLPDPVGRTAVVRPAGHPGLAWTGSVTAAAPAVGAGNVLTVWGEIENRAGDLRPGMVAEMQIVLRAEGERAITAPAEALWPSGGSWFVFLEDGGSFRRVRVVPGRRGSRFVEILQGLFPGDRVAVSGLEALDTALGSLR